MHYSWLRQATDYFMRVNQTRLFDVMPNENVFVARIRFQKFTSILEEPALSFSFTITRSKHGRRLML